MRGLAGVRAVSERRMPVAVDDLALTAWYDGKAGAPKLFFELVAGEIPVKEQG